MKLAQLSEILALPSLADDLARVQAAMLAAVRAAPAPTLAGEAQRVIRSGGKRLRPALVLAAAQISGAGIGEAAIRSAAAIELIHAGTLVHDDIMDESDTRRGVPTVYAAAGASTALMVGDYLLALAGAEAAAVSSQTAALVAATIAAMSEGQALEAAGLYNSDRTPAAYYAAIRGKTGVLLAASARLGGQAAQLPPAHLDALSRYGHEYGVAFQIADDIQDLASDLAAGVYNLPVLLGLSGSSADQLRPMLGGHPARRLDTARIGEILSKDGYVKAAAAEANRHIHQAEAALAVFEPSPIIAGLAALPAKSIG